MGYQVGGVVSANKKKGAVSIKRGTHDLKRISRWLYSLLIASAPEVHQMSGPTGPARKWANLDAKYQPISMDVKEFEYTVKPRIQHEGLPRAKCTFQGISRTPGFEGLLVLGDLESRDSDDMPRGLVHHWKNVPELIDGYAYLVNADSKGIDEAFFSIALFCRPSAFFSIIDMFSRGVSSARKGAQLNADLIHPDHFGLANYWDTEWATQTWQVAFWEVTDSVVADGYIPQ